MNKTLRIAHIFSTSSYGGSEDFALSVSKFWKNEGNYVKIINLWEGESKVARACNEDELDYVNLKCGQSFFRPSTVFKIYKFFNENEFDVILLYGLRLQLLLRLLKPFLNCRKSFWVSMLRGEDPWRKWYHILLDRFTQKRCDCHVGCSKSVCKTWIYREKYKKEKTIFIPNGIDLFKYNPNAYDKETIRLSLGLPLDHIICVVVGNFRAIKGHRFFAEAIASRSSEFIEAPIKFLFLGEDLGEAPTVMEILNNAGLGDSVIYPGQVNNVGPYLASSDLYVLPSKSEGMPRSLIEAMAMGLPSVAADVGGVSEVVRNGIDGFLVDFGNVSDMSSRILELIKNSAMRICMSKSSRENIHRNYDMERVAQKYLKLFCDVGTLDPIARPAKLKDFILNDFLR